MQESYDSLKENVMTLRKCHNDPSRNSAEMTAWGHNDSFEFKAVLLNTALKYANNIIIYIIIILLLLLVNLGKGRSQQFSN